MDVQTYQSTFDQLFVMSPIYPPGLLAEEIDKALRNSEWLIVVCSPRSAKSSWVGKEAQMFIILERADYIITHVLEG